MNTGTNYSGTTVFLDSDLSLPEITESIGNTTKNYFTGVFDGRGYIISNLEINSSTTKYTGLFGYSKGLSVKNVVLDSSCTFTNSYASASGSLYIGGIIGDCSAVDEQCNIESNVNMANVAFSSKIKANYVYLGGITGYLSYSYPNYKSYLRNCINYGSVTYLGHNEFTYIGGVVGFIMSFKPSYSRLSNCINYGTITHNGTTTFYLYLGGITGGSYYTYIENCVGAGEIFTPAVGNRKSYIGIIVGEVNSYTYINYCYYTEDVNASSLYGGGTPQNSSHILGYDGTTFELKENVSIEAYTGNLLVDALNAAADYYVMRDYSRWLFNKDNKNVTFVIENRDNSSTMNSQIILLPSLAGEGSITFDGWYNDSEWTYSLDSFEITENTVLYGKFEENTNSYTITFDTKREEMSIEPQSAQFGAVVSLPNDLTKENCSIAFWEHEHGENAGFSIEMPAHNITLYAVWKCIHIITPNDFIDFTKVVNSGIDSFSGTTVYLDSDLSLPALAEPIGKDTSNCFRGVFDGQGCVINDIKMTSTSIYTGLFGYSEGLTVRNVVLDSSCSVTGSFTGTSYAYAGGIIGYCKASNRGCTIESIVNMADITFSGIISSSTLYIGGIAGFFAASSPYAYYNYPIYVRNCGNYGFVTHSGVSTYSYIGGIVGYHTSSSFYAYIQNCLNHGSITHTDTTSDTFHLGGISGYTYYMYIDNCVSSGKISAPTTSTKTYIGSITGDVGSHSCINRCYYTSSVGVSALYQGGTPENITNTPSSSSVVNSALISSLNDYSSSNNWNKWLLNTNNAPVSFIIIQGDAFTISSQIILFPDLVDNDEHAFSLWYKDETLTSLFTSDQVNSATTLYKTFCKTSYTVTLDVNGGNTFSKSDIGTAIECNGFYRRLLTPTNEGYAFLGWFTEREEGVKVEIGDRVTQLYDHTLYAHWRRVLSVSPALYPLMKFIVLLI